MEDRRFDEFVRSFVQHGSRRSFLKLVIGGATGIVASRFGGASVAAEVTADQLRQAHCALKLDPEYRAPITHHDENEVCGCYGLQELSVSRGVTFVIPVESTVDSDKGNPGKTAYRVFAAPPPFEDPKLYAPKSVRCSSTKTCKGNASCQVVTMNNPTVSIPWKVYRLNWKQRFKVGPNCDPQMTEWLKDIEVHEGRHVQDLRSIEKWYAANVKNKKTHEGCGADADAALDDLEANVRKYWKEYADQAEIDANNCTTYSHDRFGASVAWPDCEQCCAGGARPCGDIEQTCCEASVRDASGNCVDCQVCDNNQCRACKGCESCQPDPASGLPTCKRRPSCKAAAVAGVRAFADGEVCGDDCEDMCCGECTECKDGQCVEIDCEDPCLECVGNSCQPIDGCETCLPGGSRPDSGAQECCSGITRGGVCCDEGTTCCGLIRDSCAVSGCCDEGYCSQGRCVTCRPEGDQAADASECCSGVASGEGLCCGRPGQNCRNSGCCEQGARPTTCIEEGYCFVCYQGGRPVPDAKYCCSEKVNDAGECCATQYETCTSCCEGDLECCNLACRQPCGAGTVRNPTNCQCVSCVPGDGTVGAGNDHLCCSGMASGGVCCGRAGDSCLASGCCAVGQCDHRTMAAKCSTECVSLRQSGTPSTCCSGNAFNGVCCQAGGEWSYGDQSNCCSGVADDRGYCCGLAGATAALGVCDGCCVHAPGTDSRKPVTCYESRCYGCIPPDDWTTPGNAGDCCSGEANEFNVCCGENLQSCANSTCCVGDSVCDEPTGVCRRPS